MDFIYHSAVLACHRTSAQSPFQQDAHSVPRTRLSRLGWSLWVVIWAFAGALLPAQVLNFNNWTNPHSGPWEVATNWSQGIRPASDQAIKIENSGYKAVGISASTVSDFSNSLTIASLKISAPIGSASMLLLNYAGLSV